VICELPDDVMFPLDFAGTILVTGASGFVGRHALPALRVSFPKAQLVAAHGRTDSLYPLADHTLALNLFEAASIEAAILDSKPDVVLHLASQSSVSLAFSDPIATWRANLMGTIHLADAVLRHAPQAIFVYASSSEIYGLSFKKNGALKEDAPIAPANPYAASKAAADMALGEMALRGLRAIRMRPFNHVGPGQTEVFVIAAFARQIARIEMGLQPPVVRTGALDRWRDFLDVRDVVKGYIAAISVGHYLEPGIAINIASGVPRRIGDILEELLARSGISAHVEMDAGRLRPVDVERVEGDAARALSLLGWSPQIRWEDTLDDILEYWRTHERGLLR